MHEITKEVEDYVNARVSNGNLVWPYTVEDAMLFVLTEVAEAIEVMLGARGYIRNNPEDKPNWEPNHFAQELGDAIYMLIVSGLKVGVDPLDAMLAKMRNDARADKG